MEFLFVIVFVIGWFASTAVVASLVATMTASGIAILAGIAAFVLTGLLVIGVARDNMVAGIVSCVWVLFLIWMWAVIMAPEITLGAAVVVAIVCAVFWVIGALFCVDFVHKHLLD